MQPLQRQLVRGSTQWDPRPYFSSCLPPGTRTARSWLSLGVGSIFTGFPFGLFKMWPSWGPPWDSAG